MIFKNCVIQVFLRAIDVRLLMIFKTVSYKYFSGRLSIGVGPRAAGRGGPAKRLGIMRCHNCSDVDLTIMHYRNYSGHNYSDFKIFLLIVGCSGGSAKAPTLGPLNQILCLL